MISKVGMTTEDPDVAGPVTPPDIFHMCVIDAVTELAQKLDIADSLVAKMGRVVVKAEPAMIFHSLHGAVRRSDIERHLGRVHFESEVHIVFIESIEDS